MKPENVAVKDFRLREEEIRQVSSALLSGQSMLVLGDPGAGKSTLGRKVGAILEDAGYAVAIANYGGAAKETLVAICEQLDVLIETADERPKPLTAQQLREALKERLKQPNTLLIADDAQRWSASLRYWLEDCLRGGALLLLLAYKPPAKEIFLKLSRIEMQALENDQIRAVMVSEAATYGVVLSSAQLAALQAQAGNNPALARRVVREEILGLNEQAEAGDHYQYIDGTPFLVAVLACVSLVRFIGLGLGNRSLYIMGGIFMVLAFIARMLLYRANRRSSKL